MCAKKNDSAFKKIKKGIQAHSDRRFAFWSSRPESPFLLSHLCLRYPCSCFRKKAQECRQESLGTEWRDLATVLKSISSSYRAGLAQSLPLFFGLLESFFKCSEALIPFIKAGDVLLPGYFHKLLKSILD